MARGRRDAELEQQWRARVACWHASGLSVRGFCRREGLTEPTFHYWKRELRARYRATSTQRRISQRAAAQRPAARCPTAKPSPPMFVPVTVLPGATLAVEVRCPSGHVVCLPECDAVSLASLFAALNRPASEEPSC